MQEPDDNALLREYVERNSEDAFASLVARHVNKVYSVALRHTRNPHHAEEITQAVFVILAKKSRHLGKGVILSGWLYKAARLTSVTFIRGEIRRAHREQEATLKSPPNENESNAWTQIAPLLDAAMSALNETDRQAVVLRFFDDKSLKEVGAALGANEEAAKKRISRALGKLRAFFAKRGVVSSTIVIAGALSAHSVQAAPVALAKSVTAVALTKGATAGGSTLTLIKGALKIMAWTKAKTAVITAVVVLLAVGTTTITVKQIQAHRTYPWQKEPFDFNLVDQVPPQVKILPSRAKTDNWDRQAGGAGKMMGLGMSTQQIVLRAYGARPVRTILLYKEPKQTYDFIANLPDGNPEALQEELKRALGIVAQREMIETNVMVLRVKSSSAPGLRPAADTNATPSFDRVPGGISIRNGSLTRVLALLEGQFQKPIADESGLTNHLDIDFKWNDADATFHNPETLNQVRQQIADQLGLDLAPDFRPIEMLVAEKIN